jgi:anti-sigma B factor antagonist
MEITRSEREGALELHVKGRLDGYWAQHLATAIDDVMREGVHHVRLNLAQTGYISSAGIRVLVEAYKEFAGVAGSMVVVQPSAAVKQVLELAGLAPLLGSAAAPAEAPEAAVQKRAVGGCILEIHCLDPKASLACRAVGDPSGMATASLAGRESFAAEADRFALGVGAFGESGFGEFLAVAGNAACQPTDGTNTADYMMASGSYVPKLTALVALACRGGFRNLVRFESDSAHGPAALSSIVEACLDVAGGPAGIVMVAESAGLLGASLKRPPVDGGALFKHPEVREWLSFTPERSHTRSVALVAGVAAQEPSGALAGLLRPMGGVQGHFHAAAFGYHPLQKGRIELRQTVARLFDTGGLKAVLHLLNDDRGTTGAGESELLRGACWISPITRVLGPEETL